MLCIFMFFPMFSVLYTIVYYNAGVRATFERCDESISRPFNKRCVESRTIDPAASAQRELGRKSRQVAIQKEKERRKLLGHCKRHCRLRRETWSRVKLQSEARARAVRCFFGVESQGCWLVGAYSSL